MADKKIHIYYASILKQLSASRWDAYIALLPDELREEVYRYKKWEDRYRSLYGKLLLRTGLQEFGVTRTGLHDLKYTKFGRPWLEDAPEFNISHAGHYVVAAIGIGCRLGIDIEMVAPVEFEYLRDTMTLNQWAEINQSQAPLHTFYRYWTLKESVIKGNGKGLSIPLNLLETDFKKVHVEDTDWFLTEFQLEPEHCGFLATTIEEFDLRFFSVSFDDERSPEQTRITT